MTFIEYQACSNTPTCFRQRLTAATSSGDIMHLQPLKSPIHLFSCSCKTTRAAAAAHTFLRGLRYKRGRACLCSLWEESDRGYTAGIIYRAQQAREEMVAYDARLRCAFPLLSAAAPADEGGVGLQRRIDRRAYLRQRAGGKKEGSKDLRRTSLLLESRRLPSPECP